ncbi:MAG: hypothetical protein WC379_09550 [Methanoregula sp.]
MPAVKKTGGPGPLPRNDLSDASVPEYDEIMVQLHKYPRSLIGSSYYYIRNVNGSTSLCRILPGAGSIFFHEVVDHKKQGISDKDLEEAIAQDTGAFSMPGYYPVSSFIEKRLWIYLG